MTSDYKAHQIRVARARGVRRAALQAARPVQRMRRVANQSQAEAFMADLRAATWQDSYEVLRQITASLAQR